MFIAVCSIPISMNLRIFFSSGLTRFMLVVVVWNLIYLLLGFIFAFGLNAKITPLGEPPEWSNLDRFQESISRTEFEDALTSTYCPRPEWWATWIVVEEKKARIRKAAGGDSWYDLRFKLSADEISEGNRSAGKKLEGLVIALDPGHIGGAWSKMERRHFSLGEDSPVREGDISLAVARLLVSRLQKLGARPVLVREGLQPVTGRRPDDFRENARVWADKTMGFDSNQTEEKEKRVEARAELLFYRVDEIHARARLINESIRPDLVLCLHMNAAPWPDSEKQQLVQRNDYHILINGCYMGGELSYDDQRFEMLWRLLNRWGEPEQQLAESMGRAFAQVTSLPAFSYKGPNALKIGEVPGVWARNLLANRVYRCPVIFLEPYIANSQAIYPRVQKWIREGECDGFGLVTEYAEAVLLGLQNWAAE